MIESLKTKKFSSLTYEIRKTNIFKRFLLLKILKNEA